MKTILTPEQSAMLIAKGISADKASEKIMRQSTDYKGNPLLMKKRWKDCKPYDKSLTMPHVGMTQFEDKDIFTLADICGLLPKEIVADTIICQNDICPISINWDTNVQTWFVGYGLIPHPVGVGVDSELIDALFSILCWAIDNNHVKVKQPCQS